MAKNAKTAKALVVKGQQQLAEPMPDDWMEQMSREAVDVQARLPAAANRNISIQGGRFSLGGQALEAPMNVVIVDLALERAYYPEVFNPDKPASPVCWALSYGDHDGEEGMIPSDLSAEKQNDTCLGCPRDEWGSAGGGRKGKACKSNIRTALIEADVDDPEAAKLAFLRVPIMSAKKLSAYIRSLSAKSDNKLAYFGVKTAIDFDPEAKYPELTFTAVEQIADGRIARLVQAQRRVVKEQLLQPFSPPSDDEPAPPPPSNKAPVKRKFSR